METEISKSKFKTHALEIFRHIEESGEPVVITDRGTPALIIQKIGRSADAAAKLKGSVLRYDDPFTPIGEGDWEAAK
jgi:hypothetical protein